VLIFIPDSDGKSSTPSYKQPHYGEFDWFFEIFKKGIAETQKV